MKPLKSYDKLLSLDITKNIKDHYNSLKTSSAYVGLGASLVECGFQRAIVPMSFMANQCPATVESLDKMAVSCIAKIESGYQQATQISKTASNLGVRASVGSMAVNCLDPVISKAESVVDFMTSEVHLTPPRTRSVDGSTQTTEDEALAEDDDTPSKRRVKINDSRMWSRYQVADPCNATERVLRDFLSVPVKGFVNAMKHLSMWLKINMVTRNKATWTNIPSKKSKKNKRRKMKATTAFKNSGIIKRIIDTLLSQPVISTIISSLPTKGSSKVTNDTPTKPGDANSKDAEKRKHSDISSDDSDYEEADPLNLEGYKSEEDKDWQPGCQDARILKRAMDESLEYCSGSGEEDSFVALTHETAQQQKPEKHKAEDDNCEKNGAISSKSKRNSATTQKGGSSPKPGHQDNAAKKVEKIAEAKVITFEASLVENKENSRPKQKQMGHIGSEI